MIWAAIQNDFFTTHVIKERVQRRHIAQGRASDMGDQAQNYSAGEPNTIGTVSTAPPQLVWPTLVLVFLNTLMWVFHHFRSHDIMTRCWHSVCSGVSLWDSTSNQRQAIRIHTAISNSNLFLAFNISNTCLTREAWIWTISVVNVLCCMS